jgi:TRAP-type C4-dicarboxylate transport system permease small subunit
MNNLMTPLAYLGGAIFLIAFIWKSYDFFKEAWNDAKANQFPPRKCFQAAMAHTTLLWLLILGSFAVLGITTLKADSLLIGLIVMAVWVIGMIVLLMKLSNTMPVKAKDRKDGQHP